MSGPLATGPAGVAADLLGTAALAGYAMASALLALYGLHSLWLLLRFGRARAPQPAAPFADADCPAALVQLPVRDERHVVARLVAAAGALDWPRERLRIQLLDDGSDDSVELGARAIAELRAAGLDAVHVRRAERTGFKAGALAHGLELDGAHPHGPAPVVAIFDADFVPPRDFLRRSVAPLLADRSLAFVQGRWEHLNAQSGPLTAAQALGTDGHFAIEQAARAWTGLPLNFNGTCGTWRRDAIEDAGGWQPDTLTEDLDLSYRAQLRGWRAQYLLDLPVPGELPTSLEAWRSQQFRWAKGSLQTAAKLLPSVWRSAWSARAKLAATLHLTHYLVHPLILMSLLLAPIALPRVARLPEGLRWAGAAAVLAGLLPPLLLYARARAVLRRPARRLLWLPALAALGTGIAVSNARAAWQALRGDRSPFLRTPKQGEGGGSYRAPASSGVPELLAAAWGAVGLVASVQEGTRFWAPILFLYVAGFAVHGTWLLCHRVEEALSAARVAAATRPAAAKSLLPRGLRQGALLALGLAALALVAGLVARGDTWRDAPLPFAVAGLLLGAISLAGTWLVQRSPPGRRGLLWIVAVGVGLNLLAAGRWPSDDLHRYIVEGELIRAGHDPYATSPAEAARRGLVAPEHAELANHAELTAIYPPLALLAHGAIRGMTATPTGFAMASATVAIFGLALLLALLVASGRPPGEIVATAWSPVLPLFVAGAGHNDALLVLPLLLCLLALAAGQMWAAVALAAAAVLVKPFAVVLVPIVALAAGWRRTLLLLPLLLAAAWAPFLLVKGSAPFGSLRAFATEFRFHGALEPLLSTALAPVVPAAHLPDAVRAALAAGFVAGAALLWRRRGAAPPALLLARALALLLLCLPTLHPWYFTALVFLLPFARSVALAAWTAAAPVWYLHGQAMLAAGEWTETAAVTALAHLPFLLLMALEAFGPWRQAPQPGRLRRGGLASHTA